MFSLEDFVEAEIKVSGVRSSSILTLSIAFSPGGQLWVIGPKTTSIQFLPHIFDSCI